MASKQDNYNLMNDLVVRPLLKNSRVGKELVSRIIGEVLKIDYKEIYDNIKLINEDMLFSSKVVDSRTDVMLETNNNYINIEICYTRGSTRDRQMDAYVYEVFFKQAIKSEKLKNMKNIIQIMLENYDYFKRGKFCYKVIPMEETLLIPDKEFIIRYHFNLALIRKINYNSIINEKDVLKKILYVFVCKDEELEKTYKGDKFMEEVVKVARAISGKEKIPLYLSEEEIRKLDREEAVQEGYDKGKQDGINQGIEQKQNEMVINMYKKNYDMKIICDATNLLETKIKEIIKNYNNK